MLAELRTERLWLRRWREEDRPALAEMNADPAVVRYLPRALTRVESDALMDALEVHFDAHGFGPWAVELCASRALLGLVGLKRVAFEARFTPAVEIAWRLHPAAWGQGYAVEAARAVMQAAFAQLGLAEVVSFTVPANRASWRVMEKLGMQCDGEFDHPGLPAGHPLQRHVLYRLSAPAQSTRSA
jgi:RimJ/RimL family protein N-acetyltransferase